MPCDDPQAAVGARDGSGWNAGDVDVKGIVPRAIVGTDFGYDLRQVFPFDVGRGVEYAECDAAERGLAARVEDIPGQPHTKPGRHGRLPAASAPRNTSRPRRNAFCNSN